MFNKKFILIIYITLILINLKITIQKQARCFMIPDKDSKVSGDVKFTQENENSPVKIQLLIYGAKSIHGFHMHEKGSIEDGCLSAGAHYNPLNLNHGGPNTDIRHMGDLGNIITKDGNSIIYTFENDKVSLYGNYSIIGRTCVVHAQEDDLGTKNNTNSLTTGNSGPRLSCGVLHEYNALYSVIFGISILIIGIASSIYYFFVYRKRNPSQELVENEVRHN